MATTEKDDVFRLGPMWVEELKASTKKRRDHAKRQAASCKPDGDYRKQIEMVVAELDLMLAAPALLAACQAQHKAIDYLMARLIEANTGFRPTESKVWPIILATNAAIAEATGSPT